MQQAGSRRPSAALVVATIALVVAASGSAFAAGQMVTGDNLIRKDSLSGNRLRFRTLTGTQINLKKLGTVPTAVPVHLRPVHDQHHLHIELRRAVAHPPGQLDRGQRRSRRQRPGGRQHPDRPRL